MKKALILYQSKTGTTQKMGEAISNFLTRKGIRAELKSAESWDNKEPLNYDYLFLGCWTKGLMIINQHPEKQWSRLVSDMQIPENARITLFATYKIAIGSMFRRMRKSLNGTSTGQEPELKSKDGGLNKEAERKLAEIVS